MIAINWDIEEKLNFVVVVVVWHKITEKKTTLMKLFTYNKTILKYCCTLLVNVYCAILQL